MTTIQKNPLVRLRRARPGATSAIHGAMVSAPRWAMPVTPKPTAATFMVSASWGMRTMLDW